MHSELASPRYLNSLGHGTLFELDFYLPCYNIGIMNKKLLRVCAIIIGISGFTIFGSTVYPIVEYEINARQNFPILISSRVEDSFNSEYSTAEQDYTKASNWFVGSEDKLQQQQEIEFFTLTVPKLGIHNATVAVGGDDLSQHLIQYSGTALPGAIGNSVIFGHSILPTYYDPSNYMAIFSTLPELSKGDRFYTTFDNVTYAYEVESMFEVRPTDLWILEQSNTDSYVSLVTCSPPGDPRKPKRLIVRAKLVTDVQANARQVTE